MNALQRVKRSLIRRLLPLPVQGRHVEYSAIASVDDDGAAATPSLISVALKAIEATREISLADLHARSGGVTDFTNLWPGEHYRLLAGFVRTLRPRRIVEIGTGAGGSTLSMKHELPPDGKITTFDVIACEDVVENVLRKDDFADGRLVQHVEDVSRPDVMALRQDLFKEADLIYLDAAKDGQLEQDILDSLEELAFPKPVLLICDDIRVWNMLAIWRRIRHPKLDLTSFGHWTGTGLVEWPASRPQP